MTVNIKNVSGCGSLVENEKSEIEPKPENETELVWAVDGKEHHGCSDGERELERLRDGLTYPGVLDTVVDELWFQCFVFVGTRNGYTSSLSLFVNYTRERRTPSSNRWHQFKAKARVDARGSSTSVKAGSISWCVTQREC
ncbi:hypothetical protein C8R45DRAFT_933890 [Mycena sanguinolenta]|nr:hypothetical protein C8R45DRAFT_933890 [Mycena sanguinolenta]